MPHRPRVAFALAVGFAAICAPILASIYLAWHQSLAAQKSLSLTYARDTLRRADEVSGQFGVARRSIATANFPPCSPRDIDLLRQIGLGSSYIQAVGRTSGNTLICTSLGGTTQIPLGKPNLISTRGVAGYINVKLSPQQWHPLDVFAAGSVAILVDPSLPIDIPTEGSDVELNVFVASAPTHDRLAVHGNDFQPGWFESVTPGSGDTFLDHGYIVSRIRSSKSEVEVIAAIPEHYVYQLVSHFALIFAPFGVICGILFAWAVNYITQLRTSFPVILRRAIRDKEFYVEYQPIVKLDSRRIIGAEALVRWKSPLANIPPDHFIPLAEDRGLIHLITEQVLAAVTDDLPQLLAIDSDFEVAINMSAGDLRSGRTLTQLDQLLQSTGALPHNVSIEATERAFLHHSDTAQLIAALRSRGFRVSIDDFGTGYSSLACLQSLSLDTLKIDKAFVETINTDGATSQVVVHIIEMARSLHLQTIAEGVETEAQAEFLRKRGVRYAQGWLFGKSMPIAALLKRIPASTPEPVAVRV